MVLSFMSNRRSIAGPHSTERYSAIPRTHFRALSMRAPHANRLRMSLQPLGLRQCDYSRSNLRQPLTRELLKRDDLHEIHHAQSAAKTGGSARRQHVIGPNRIIAGSLWGVIANENRTRMANV